MANIIVPNFPLESTNNTFSAIWKATRAMKKAGYTYICSSDGSSVDITGVAGSDKWGGSIDPITDSYPSLSSGAWWSCQGPSTIKIPIGYSTPTGTGFVRGEKITQLTSNAEGEFLGIIIDISGGAGYLVISPRTGTFDTNTITGFISNSSISPTATPIIYTRNIVFWYNTALTGHIYYQTIDLAGESTHNFFSTARMASVTNIICPGGSSSGDNVFPNTGSFVALGTGGSGAVTTGYKNWSNATPLANYGGTAQIMVANAETSTGVSSDGSFTIAMSTPNGGTGAYVGLAFLKCNDYEDGDIDPYVWFVPNAALPYTNNYLVNTTNVTTTDRVLHSDLFGGGLTVSAINYNAANQGIAFRGFRRRGLTSETFQEFTGTCLATENINGDTTFSSTGYLAILEESSSDSETAATVVGTQIITDKIYIVSFENGYKMRKGSLKWWYFVQGGVVNDTYDTKNYIRLSGTNRKPVIAGPWDGTTIPSST